MDRKYVALSQRLGAGDRTRLEEHLAKIRDIEMTLVPPAPPPATCITPMQVDTSDYNPRSGLNSADDGSIQADGADATRLTFRAVDAYGNQRPHVTGDVTLSLAGPATLVGENPFAFGTYGGVGGAFVRSQPGQAGLVSVTARHPLLGQAAVRIAVTSTGPAVQFR